MRLVDDHAVPPRRERFDFVEHVRELLQRRYDDPRLFPGQRLGELARIPVDPHDDAVHLLELVDGLLQPEYQRMLADAAAGGFDALYAWKYDRLGRDAEELLRARRMLEAAGVRLVSATEGEAESTLIYTVRAAVAQEEREKISERTRLGLAEAARSGRIVTGAAPLGYRRVGSKTKAGDDRRLVVDPDEAGVVRRIFDLYLQGVGINRIAQTLNAAGQRTRRGAKFSARVVLDVLDQVAYLGHVRFKGEVVAEDHPALIDREAWDRVQTLRQAKREQPSGGRRRPPKNHLLAGKLYCPRGTG